MAAGGRAVELRVNGEHAARLFFGQALSRIHDFEVDRDAGPFGLVPLCTHHHLAGVGEFHRVADDVDEDLAKPARVSDHDVGYIGSLVQDELDALVHGRLREQLDRLLDHVSRAELHGLQAHAAGLDPREVKDVVDDLEQRVARDADRLHVLLLLGCEPGIHQQTRHSDDTAQRSSDLVAHRGQKFGFQARQLLQVLVAQREVGQEHGLLGLGLDGGLPVLLELGHDAPDQDPESHQQQGFQDGGGGIARGRVDERDEDQIRHGEHRSDRELDGRVVEREEDQRQEHEGKRAQDAEPELHLEREGHGQAADGRYGVEVSRNPFPRQQDERPTEDGDHDR